MIYSLAFINYTMFKESLIVYHFIFNRSNDTLVDERLFLGAHCLDLFGATESDPGWLVEQRKKEIEIMKGWITQYYADLGALKWTSKFQSKPKGKKQTIKFNSNSY